MKTIIEIINFVFQFGKCFMSFAAQRCSSSIYAMNIANIDVIMQNMLLLYVLIISNMFKVQRFAVQRYAVQQKKVFPIFMKMINSDSSCLT